MPGCQRGSCVQPLDCLCDEGWRGLFCSMRKFQFAFYSVITDDCNNKHVPNKQTNTQTQQSVRPAATGITAGASDRVSAGVASAGPAATAPTASPIPDASTDPAPNRGPVTVMPSGAGSRATKSWTFASSSRTSRAGTAARVCRWKQRTDPSCVTAGPLLLESCAKSSSPSETTKKNKHHHFSPLFHLFHLRSLAPIMHSCVCRSFYLSFGFLF